MAAKENKAGVVKSADRLMTLLEHLSASPGSSFASIAHDLNLPVSSTHQLLSTAAMRGFVEFSDESRTYSLGPRLYELTRTSSENGSIVSVAKPIMDQLTATTEETVQLSVLDGMENVYLAITESPHPMKLVSSVGARLPAHATGLGKTLLATLDEDDLVRRVSGLELESFTDNTITDTDELLAEIELIRIRGYGEDREEYLVGLRCIAMPIKTPHKQDTCALSVSVPTPRFTAKLERKIHTQLRMAVSQIEAKLVQVGQE